LNERLGDIGLHDQPHFGVRGSSWKGILSDEHTLRPRASHKAD
jgi:hypothetical protein